MSIPEYQKQGIGSRLIREGLKVCRAAGYDAVVVLGPPAYYSRFGFGRASNYSLSNEYNAEEAFRVLELRENALVGVTARVRYSPEFRETGC